jgi:hypothetical protein
LFTLLNVLMGMLVFVDILALVHMLVFMCEFVLVDMPVLLVLVFVRMVVFCDLRLGYGNLLLLLLQDAIARLLCLCHD